MTGDRLGAVGHRDATASNWTIHMDDDWGPPITCGMRKTRGTLVEDLDDEYVEHTPNRLQISTDSMQSLVPYLTFPRRHEDTVVMRLRT